MAVFSDLAQTKALVVLQKLRVGSPSKVNRDKTTAALPPTDIDVTTIRQIPWIEILFLK